jgi:predicted ArsR family transcriptional regulator
MVDTTIETGVDKLINLLKTQEKISISDAAKKLGIPTRIIQTWVDFLIEEKVISIEYKFTQPFIYLNKAEKKTSKEKEKFTMQDMKDEFFNRAKKKNLTEEQTRKLWEKKLITEIEKHKVRFYDYAKARKIENIDKEWEDFHMKITGVS